MKPVTQVGRAGALRKGNDSIDGYGGSDGKK